MTADLLQKAVKKVLEEMQKKPSQRSLHQGKQTLHQLKQHGAPRPTSPPISTPHSRITSFSLRQNASPCQAVPRNPSTLEIRAPWSSAVPAVAKRGSMSSPTCSSVISPMWSPTRTDKYNRVIGKRAPSKKGGYQQFHKIASYTHSHNADYYGIPLIPILPKGKYRTIK